MLGTLEAALDELVEADPSTLAGGEAIEALHRQLARLEAVTTRAVAAFDASQRWQAGGARTAAAWMSLRCSLPKAVAHRRVRLGRALRQLPAAEAAWLDGAIGSDHVSALAGARTPATAEAMDRDQAMLVGQARTLRYDQFRRVLAYWYGHADPDGTERSAQELRDGRAWGRSPHAPEEAGVGAPAGAAKPPDERPAPAPVAGLGGHLGARRPARPHLGGDSGPAAGAHRGRAVRGRLGRGPGPAGGAGRRRRPAPQPGPAPGRRPGGDGHPGRHRPDRRPAPRAAVQRVRGL